jgi:hypothetical protein
MLHALFADLVQIDFGLLWSDVEQSHVVMHDEAVTLCGRAGAQGEHVVLRDTASAEHQHSISKASA